LQPVGSGLAVIVGERDEPAAGGGEPRVAGGRESAAALAANDARATRGGYLRGLVGRGVIDEDDLVVAVLEALRGERRERERKGAGSVVRADDDAREWLRPLAGSVTESRDGRAV
jgi:hypothetical protein